MNMMVPQIAPTGRLTRKHHRQVVLEAIAPPIKGPEAAAMAHVAPINEVHFARSLFALAYSTSDARCGRKDWVEEREYRNDVRSVMMMFTRPMIPPPPIPWIILDAINMFII